MADEQVGGDQMLVVSLDQYKDHPAKEGFSGDHVIKESARGNPHKDANTGKFSTEMRAKLSRHVSHVKLFVKEK